MADLILKQSPNIADRVTHDGNTWEWNGRAWRRIRPDVTQTGEETLTNKMLKNVGNTVQVLQDQGNIVWDAANGCVATVTLNGNRNIAAPINAKPGAQFTLFVKQDSVGNRTLTFGTGFNISTAYTLSTAANAVDAFMFMADSTGLQFMGMQVYKGQPGSAPPPPPPAPAPTPPAPAPTPTPSPPPATSTVAVGPNLSGMEWANASGNTHRTSASSRPNINFAVPRLQDIAYMAMAGMKKSRLPVSWEMLQPIRASSPANSTIRSGYGVSSNGAFYEVYAQYIDKVLDAHAAMGVKCIIDLHNYGRYRDFIYNGDGSVTGFVNPAEELVQPYTTDSSKVRTCIMSKAAGATLTVSDFTDFWTRAANRWKNHAGFGGYGLMNEIHDMPANGGTVETTNGTEDLTIWTHFATQAYNAIRAVDATGTIYIGGNKWGSAISFGSNNPGFPIVGATNVVYEGHLYLDAASNGHYFDWDTEVAKGFSAGEAGGVALNLDSAKNRLKYLTDWSIANGNVKVGCTEVGLPLHHDNWNEAFKRMMDHAIANNCEVFVWMGGNHWPAQSYPVNMTTEWYQNRLCQPIVSGYLERAVGVNFAQIFDAGGGYAPTGSVTIEVFARGHLTSPVTLTMASSNGGTFNPTSVTLAAGVANPSATYTFTPGANRVTTISYSGHSQVPPARKVFSLTDPVAYSATNLEDAALAILAKYSACKWDSADAYTDYVSGAVCGNGDAVRAIGDTGWGSKKNNIMDMRQFMNYEVNMGWFTETRLALDGNGKKYVDFNAVGRRGLWCKKRAANQEGAGTHPNPQSVIPYWLHEAHFTIATVRVPTPSTASGTVCAASVAESTVEESLNLANGVPRVVMRDVNGLSATVTSSVALAANTPTAISFRNKPGNQNIRVNGTQRGTGTSSFTASQFNQLFFGGNWSNYWPGDPFPGGMYNMITGKGDITDNELVVLENYSLQLAGSSVGAPAPSPTPSPPPPAPAPSQSAEDSTLSSIAAISQGAVWDIYTTSSLYEDAARTNVAEGTEGEVIMSISDRSGKGNHITQAIQTEGQNHRTDGTLRWVEFWTKGNSHANLGGSTSGFIYAVAYRLGGGYYNTFFSDRNGTNGYLLEYDGDIAALRFRAGPTAVVTLPFTPGTDAVIFAWHDGSQIHLQLNNGTPVSAPCGTIAAGGAGVIGTNPDGTRPAYGRYYASVMAKNTALTLAERNNIKTFLGQRAGLSL